MTVTGSRVDEKATTAVRSRPLLVGASALAGLAIAVLWSATLVDDDIGVNTANGILGQNAATADLTGTVTGLIFAFVTGLAGTFTACNIAVFGAIGPALNAGDRSFAGRLAVVLRPLGWIALGAAVVAGAYGAIGAVLGSRLPQLSSAMVGQVPARILQSVVVFGVIGVIMIYLGLAAAGLVPDPLNRLAARWAPVRHVVLGALVGGFLIGRPWPLFHKMFLHAAATHDAAFGAATFVLVVIGNMLVMGLVFVLLTFTSLPKWLAAKPNRVLQVTSAALLVAGTFTVAYWCLRVPSHFGIGWFPAMPWS